VVRGMSSPSRWPLAWSRSTSPPPVGPSGIGRHARSGTVSSSSRCSAWRAVPTGVALSSGPGAAAGLRSLSRLHHRDPGRAGPRLRPATVFAPSRPAGAARRRHRGGGVRWLSRTRASLAPDTLSPATTARRTAPRSDRLAATRGGRPERRLSRRPAPAPGGTASVDLASVGYASPSVGSRGRSCSEKSVGERRAGLHLTPSCWGPRRSRQRDLAETEPWSFTPPARRTAGPCPPALARRARPTATHSSSRPCPERRELLGLLPRNPARPRRPGVLPTAAAATRRDPKRAGSPAGSSA
jgi:hypothetical protein